MGVVVCCDRRAVPAAVLGRATFPDADMWSCACAIENLWLAARAEGLGLGWVTLFPPDELASLVGLPAGVETLGWLCLGWPDELPPNPGLERAGWSRRAPLDTVVLHERWDAGSKPPAASHAARSRPGCCRWRPRPGRHIANAARLAGCPRPGIGPTGRTGDRRRRPGQSGAGGRRPPGHPAWGVDLPLHGYASGARSNRGRRVARRRRGACGRSRHRGGGCRRKRGPGGRSTRLSARRPPG